MTEEYQAVSKRVDSFGGNLTNFCVVSFCPLEQRPCFSIICGRLGAYKQTADQLKYKWNIELKKHTILLGENGPN